MLQPVIDEQKIMAEARSMNSLRDVGKLGAQVLREYYPEGAGMCLRPITSGGIIINNAPSKRANIEALAREIRRYQQGNEEDVPVFNQLLLKGGVDYFLQLWRQSSKSGATGYFDGIKYDFYEPMLDTGLIVVLFLHEDWKKSQTCNFVRGKVLTTPARANREKKILPLAA